MLILQSKYWPLNLSVPLSIVADLYFVSFKIV